MEFNMKNNFIICEARLQSIRLPRLLMIGKSHAAAAKSRRPSNRMASLEKSKPIDVCVEVRMRLRRTLLGLSQEKLGDWIRPAF